LLSEKNITTDEIVPSLFEWNMDAPQISFNLLGLALRSCSEATWDLFFRAEVLEQKLIPFLREVSEYVEDVEKELWGLVQVIAEKKMGMMRLCKYLSR
jgi:hypothetical protein